MTSRTAAVWHTDAAQTEKLINKHTKHKQTKVRTERKANEKSRKRKRNLVKRRR